MSDISFKNMAFNSQQQSIVKVILTLKKMELLEQMELEEMRSLRNKPAFWVNPFLSRRQKYDVEAHLLKDLLWGDGKDYTNFCRMSASNFEHLLSLVNTFMLILICAYSIIFVCRLNKE